MPLHDVEELCRRVVPGGGAVTVEPLGEGLLSGTYRVAREGAFYSLKIAAEDGLGLAADLGWEVRLLEGAAAAGVAPPVAYCDPRAGVLLTRWVSGRQWSNEATEDARSAGRIAELLRRVHALEAPQPPRCLTPAQWIEIYAREDASLRAPAAARIRQLQQLAPAAKVVCHSDLHALNLVEHGQSLILLDWEYAHVADPLWDLAGWSANNDLAPEYQWRLLTDYIGGSPASGDWQRLRLNLWLYDYVCLLWSQLYLSKRVAAEAGSAVAERARLLDARLRLPAHYAA